jgi:Spy/CpxP family protein refolding chaperone
MRESTMLPIHPRTGLQAVGIVKGRPVWPVRGGSEPPEPPAPPAPPEPPQYTPPASQADLDRIVEQRLARERQKYADYDAVKQRAEAYDALELELSSDMDKAARAASEDGYNAAMALAVPRVVRAEFKAEAKGVLTPEQLDALLEDVDLTRYATDDGEPDSERIQQKIAKFAPAPSGATSTRVVTLGQGAQRPAQPSQRELGRAAAEKRFGTKK